MRKKALIIGVTGKDGFCLSKFLLSKGYDVIGMERDFTGNNFGIVKTLSQNVCKDQASLSLVIGDLVDTVSLCKVLSRYKPDEIYNVALYHTFEESFAVPEEVSDFYGLGTIRLLEAVDKICRKSKIFNLIPNSVFADTKDHAIVRENSLKEPIGPLNLAKNYAYQIGQSYRKTHGLYISHGFVPERYLDVTGYGGIVEDIAEGLSKITLGIEQKFSVELDLDQEYEWGYVGDIVEAMWMSLQQYAGDDYVFGVGKCHSIRNFVKIVCDFLEMKVEWSKGVAKKEILIDQDSKRAIMEVSKSVYTALEHSGLRFSGLKSKKILGWEHKTNFEKLSHMLIEHNYNRIKRII